MNQLQVVEYTDPVCSWAWGSEPKLRLLRWRYESQVEWRRAMGGLVGDATNRRADWDPIKAAQPMPEYWKRVTQHTGAPYPVRMDYMLRSTNPAGQAVKAAERQGEAVAQAVLRRFRESTFLFGRPPGERDQILESVTGVPGLDSDRFASDLELDEVAAAYQADWEETRRPNDHVRNLTGSRVGLGDVKHSEGHDRYAFPTLVFSGPGGQHTVPGWMDYADYEVAMEAALAGSTANPRPDPSPEDAFARWPVLTPVELAALCGAHAEPPAEMVAFDWGDGICWMTPAEARARGIVPV